MWDPEAPNVGGSQEIGWNCFCVVDFGDFAAPLKHNQTKPIFLQKPRFRGSPSAPDGVFDVSPDLQSLQVQKTNSQGSNQYSQQNQDAAICLFPRKGWPDQIKKRDKTNNFDLDASQDKNKLHHCPLFLRLNSRSVGHSSGLTSVKVFVSYH